MLCCIIADAFANPIPGPDLPRRHHALVTEYLASGSESAAHAWLDTLAQYSFGDIADSTRMLVADNLDVFAPLLAESQLVARKIDRGLNGWLLPRATPSARRLMCAALRSRLSESEETLASRNPRRSEAKEGSAERWRWIREMTRVDAAELLSDWRDTLAIPLIEARRESIVLKAGSWDSMSQVAVIHWWHLQQAALRIPDPLAGAIALPTDYGTIETHRAANEIASARFCEGRNPDTAVSRETAARLLEMLPSSTDAVSVPKVKNSSTCGAAAYVDFADGGMMRLRLLEDDRVEYADNLRTSMSGIRLTNPGIRDLLKEIRNRAAASW
jgi:hypothetical protein